MTRPRLTSRYPASFLAAVERTISLGEITIPSEKPDQLRAQFYGFLAALRKEGKTELADAVALFIKDNSLVLKHRDQTPAALEVAAALESLPTTPDDPEDVFARLTR